MTYLYGDSTPSTLESNYLELLRRLLDCAVPVLLGEHRIRMLESDAENAQRSAEAELDRLSAFERSISQAITASAAGTPTRTIEECAAAIASSAASTISNKAAQLRQELATHLRRIDQEIQRERAQHPESLARLLLEDDLPDTLHSVRIDLESTGSYTASLRARSKLSLEYTANLSIPAGHPMAEPLRVGSLREELEIHLPEESGLVRKSVKLKPYKLSRDYITQVSQGPNETTVELRPTPQGDESGLEVRISSRAPKLTLVRLLRGGQRSAPFEPSDADRPALIELCAELTRLARALIPHRAALVSVSFEDVALAEHTEPIELIRRTVGRLAPAIRDIAAHSLADSELVLKRVLADGRREEIFIPKAELLEKIEQTPAELRGIFAPFGLGDLGGQQAAKSGPDARTLHAASGRAGATSRPRQKQPSGVMSSAARPASDDEITAVAPAFSELEGEVTARDQVPAKSKPE